MEPVMERESDACRHGRAGRPEKAPVDRRSRRVTVWMTEGELAVFERRRVAVGIPGLGVYVRQAALSQRAPRAVVPEVNREAWWSLARATANLNQIAAHLNGGGRFDERGTARLTHLLDAVREEVRLLQLALTGPIRDDADDGGE